jgi:hypothetical protein
MDESSYAYLLGLYLGDGHIVRGPRDVYVLAIACSDDWPGLMAAARQAMAAVMPASSVCGVKQTGCTMIKSYSKHWACLFPQHGPGRKHQRKIELAQWQEIIVRKYPGEFARGLFHSDGWRGVNRVRRTLADGDHWYEYLRYMFGNESVDILRLCGEVLDRLGVTWRYSRRNSISVARREAVARLDEFVGPKYLGPVRRVEVLGLGQRPAARGQAGPNPGHVGVARRVVGDHGDGLTDRLRRFGLAHVLELPRDRLHVALAQLAAEQGEQRDVVDVGYAFGIAGPQPLDDQAEEGWHRHVREPSR